MWVRFTEVIRYGGKDINMYFVQETNDPLAATFCIYVKNEESFSFRMFKEQGNKWTVDPQNVPQWVFELQPQLNNVLEKTVNSNYASGANGQQKAHQKHHSSFS
jgi:hypothetical protein